VSEHNPTEIMIDLEFYEPREVSSTSWGNDEL
jgi:hypothetical protein